jgi:hypothetical protein
LQRHIQVGDGGLEPAGPRSGVGPGQAVLAANGQRREVLGVPAADRRPVVPLVEPGGGEQAHRGEHAEPVGLAAVDQQPGGIDQPADGPGERGPAAPADGAGVGHGERASEDAQRR